MRLEAALVERQTPRDRPRLRTRDATQAGSQASSQARSRRTRRAAAAEAGGAGRHRSPGERMRPTPRAPRPRLGGTATGFTGDSFPRTGRAWWWLRRQREQRGELHGSRAQPLLCGLFLTGSPRPGTRHPGRTNAGSPCAAHGRAHSPRQTPRRGDARARVGGALLHSGARADQAAAETATPRCPSGASTRRGRNPGHVLRGRPEHAAEARAGLRGARESTGRASRSAVLLRGPRRCCCFPRHLRKTAQFFIISPLSSCKCVPRNWWRVSLLPLRLGTVHSIMLSNQWLLVRKRIIDPCAPASCSAQHLHPVPILFFHLVLLGF